MYKIDLQTLLIDDLYLLVAWCNKNLAQDAWHINYFTGAYARIPESIVIERESDAVFLKLAFTGVECTSSW